MKEVGYALMVLLVFAVWTLFWVVWCFVWSAMWPTGPHMLVAPNWWEFIGMVATVGFAIAMFKE